MKRTTGTSGARAFGERHGRWSSSNKRNKFAKSMKSEAKDRVGTPKSFA